MSDYSLATALMSGHELETAVPLIANAGFCLVELCGDRGHLSDWRADPVGTRRMFADAGIKVGSVHSPAIGWNNDSPDETVRRASIEEAIACFSQAAAVGAQVVICHANTSSDAHTLEEFERNWARSVDSLAILAHEAKAAGVKMAVENLPARGTPRPCATIPQVRRMIEGFGDHVGICLDAGHSNANGISAADEVIQAGSRLLALHIQDTDGLGDDQHWVPGHGTTDWEAFLGALDEIDFCGLRTFEVIHGDEIPALLEQVSKLARMWGAR